MAGEESFSDRMSRQARDWARHAGSKTERYARVGRLQLDLLGLRRESQQELQALGARVFELFQTGAAGAIAEDPIAGPILRKLDRLDAEKIRRQEQIERARDASGSGEEVG